MIIPREPKAREARSATRRRGSTMIEFAFIVTVLLVMILGIIEFGWMAKNRLQLANAVREGARSAAIGKSTGEIESVIQNHATGIPGSPGQLTVTLRKDDDGETGGYSYTTALGNNAANSSGVVYNNCTAKGFIQVTASIPHRSLTGMPFSTGKTLQTTVIMRRESTG